MTKSSPSWPLTNADRAYQDISDDSPPTLTTTVGSIFASFRRDRALNLKFIDPPQDIFKNLCALFINEMSWYWKIPVDLSKQVSSCYPFSSSFVPIPTSLRCYLNLSQRIRKKGTNLTIHLLCSSPFWLCRLIYLLMRHLRHLHLLEPYRMRIFAWRPFWQWLKMLTFWLYSASHLLIRLGCAVKYVSWLNYYFSPWFAEDS